MAGSSESSERRNGLKRDDFWIIENYKYRRAPNCAKEFAGAVSLHNHCEHSIENLGSVDQVIKLGFMKPFRGILQSAFGLSAISELRYQDVYYRPPLSAADVLSAESEAAFHLGFSNFLLAITDHDEVAGGLDLLRAHPDDSDRFALGEELSFRFDGHLFHLGVLGFQLAQLQAAHAALQSAARGTPHSNPHSNQCDALFDLLYGQGYLVVLNHPLVPWGQSPPEIPTRALLQRYGSRIHALEYNGMRSREENDAVLRLARESRKPVVGGGDSHLLLSSSVLSLTNATRFSEFMEEVKAGQGVCLLTPAFFAPVDWKIFLRVMYFIAHYRRIGHFRGQPVREMLAGRVVMLDAVGIAARAFLGLTSALGLLR
jgi:hypothetical protein